MEVGMKKSILLYTDTLRVLEELDDKQSGILFKCIKAFYEEDNDTLGIMLRDPIIRVAFVPFRESFERNRTKYEAVCERNRKNGSNGGRPRKTKNNPVGFSETQNNPKNLDSDSESDSDSKSDSESDSKSDNLSSYADKSLSVKDAKASTSSDDDATLVLTPPDGDCESKKDYSYKVMKFWNNVMKSPVAIPTIAKMTPKRKTVVNARVKEFGINAVYQAISKASESSFLNGGGSKGFLADFDWVFRPNNFPKVLEGNYDDVKPINKNGNGTNQQQSREQREADLRAKERIEFIATKYGDIG